MTIPANLNESCQDLLNISIAELDDSDDSLDNIDDNSIRRLRTHSGSRAESGAIQV